MKNQPPEPPPGIDDVHTQPGLLSDSQLHVLEDMSKEEMFAQLTQFVDEDGGPSEKNQEHYERTREYISNCISYRAEIRPDSLREKEELPEEISRTTVGGWVWYDNGRKEVKHDVSDDKAKVTSRGKYLFFTPHVAKLLEDIIIREFQKRPFQSAKIPTIPGKREDWVLCLYAGDDRYISLFKQEYNELPNVRFREFKTNAATRRGEYSDRFKNQ